MGTFAYDNLAYIASCSFGKDSIATILLALEHGEPLDAAVFSEVMFDHRRNISGEMPEHIEWIYSTAIPRLAVLGVRVDVVRSEKDYLTLFHTVIGSGTHKGMLRGWLIGGKCCANRDLKIQPIHRYYGRFRKQGVVQYVGIAADEPRRLARMQDKGYIHKTSLLAKYGYTEADARHKCEEYGLLSPLYPTAAFRSSPTCAAAILNCGSNCNGFRRSEISHPKASNMDRLSRRSSGGWISSNTHRRYSKQLKINTIIVAE